MKHARSRPRPAQRLATLALAALGWACSSADARGWLDGGVGDAVSAGDGAPARIDADGGERDDAGDASGANTGCTPCYGNCIPEVVFPTAAAPFALLQNQTLYHRGNGVSDWSLYRSTPTTTEATPFQPTELWKLVTNGISRVVLLESNELSLLEPETGALQHELVTKGVVSWSPERVYAVTDAGIYYPEHEGGKVNFFDFATKVESAVASGLPDVRVVLADDSGVYLYVAGNAVYRLQNGVAQPIATGLILPYWADDWGVLANDYVYFSGGPATTSGRVCWHDKPHMAYYSLIRRIPKAGGPVSVFKIPFTQEVPPVSVRAGDDQALILSTLSGCGNSNLLVMPADGSAAPRRLLAPGFKVNSGGTSGAGTIQVFGSYVYFAVHGQGIARVCRTL